MKLSFKYVKWPIVFLLFAVVSCSERDEIKPQVNQQNTSRTTRGVRSLINGRVAGSFFEDFESGTKTSYTEALVTLSTGDWDLYDALLGTSTSDRKTGAQSVRIRNSGILSMWFDLTTGASTVNVKHAVYGADGSSSWELWMSTDAGNTYAKIGSTITTSSTTLANVTFSVNVQGMVSFEIRKVSGGSYRINIDEFEVVPYGSTPPAGTDGDNMLFGNPSGATNSISNENNYLFNKGYYIMSYNRGRATPNWVSWYVGPTSLGSAPRQNDFRADTSLPAGWYQVGATSYSGSGFDRGHNCPSADRTSTVEANSATFLMDNMIPQAPNNNQQTWANLENYGRTLINSGYEIYVIMGSYGTGGTGSSGTFNTIDNGHVTVPNRVWKVIVVIPQGTNDLSRVTSTTRVIAIDTPNNNSISSAWGTYRTTVDAIEAATGYDILSALPDSIEAALESKVDSGPTI